MTYQTPPRNNHSETPNSYNSNNSQYSDEYNNQWNTLIHPTNNNTNPRINTPDNEDFIQGRSLFMSDLDGPDSPERELLENQIVNPTKKIWAERDMPVIPEYPAQLIDINEEGWDPYLMDKQIVKEYIKEDTEKNVAILYNNKVYLTTRDIIGQQEDDAIVYECLEGDKKRFDNIVGNLPLYNIKKIGINISSDNAVGIESEYIYLDGIDDLLTSVEYWPYYSIIPLPDKQLVSVISLNEAGKVGTDQGSGVSALHCQAGQGGLAGIMVKAYPSSKIDISGGKKKKRTKKKKSISMKKRKTIKKSHKKRRTFSKKK